MYRSDLNPRDKGGAIIAVGAIHVALLLAFLNLAGKLPLPGEESVLRMFDISHAKPPPPPPPPAQQRAKPKQKEGGSAPRNVKSAATPVVAPKPPIVIPEPPKIATSPTPRQGTAPTQGASTPGPGTGAGGVGNGTGNGTGGNGPGGGGDGGYVSPPQLLTPTLRGRDFARQSLDLWPRGAEVFLRLRIDDRGSVSQCLVDRGTGVASIDTEICRLIQARFRYRPALNRAGQAVAGWAGYRQVPPR